MKNYHNILIAVSVILLLMVISFVGGCSYNSNKERITTNDTVVVVVKDTVKIVQPKEVFRYSTHTVIDTLYIASGFNYNDSAGNIAAVEIPLECAVYSDTTILNQSDTLGYTAYVSGYRSKLDSISFRLSKTDKYITKTVEKKKRWGIGVQAGVGVGYNGRVIFTPYVGVGISYNIWNF